MTFETLQRDERGYDRLAARLRDNTGISLPRNSKNLALMAGRLLPTLQSRKLESFSDYEAFLSAAPSSEISHFVVQLTTNTTHFFREAAHFKLFSLELQEMFAAAQPPRELRVWCAAASTGQEPFTILMTVLEAIQGHNVPVRLLATDIDTEALRRAATAEYSFDEIENVPPHLVAQTFVRSARSPETHVVVRKKLRDLITFSQFNLMTDRYPFRHLFDAIFCRNVMIYFEPETSHAVLQRMCGVLRPGGLLFVGHAETGLVRNPDLKMLGPACYVRGGRR